MRNREIFARSLGNIEIGSLCFGFGMPVCNLVMSQLFGRKTNQRNEVSHQLDSFEQHLFTLHYFLFIDNDTDLRCTHTERFVNITVRAFWPSIEIRIFWQATANNE